MNSQKILVIEDHPVNRELLTSLLEAHGYEVIVADTGSVGIGLARADLPQLILMDLSLPDINGIDLTRQLKADPATTAIPVVMVTAHAFAKDRAAAHAAGCSGFVSKPVDTRVLMSEIKRILERPTAAAGGAA